MGDSSLGDPWPKLDMEARGLCWCGVRSSACTELSLPVEDTVLLLEAKGSKVASFVFGYDVGDCQACWYCGDHSLSVEDKVLLLEAK